VLDVLRGEIKNAMMLSGCVNFASVTPALVRVRS